MSLKTKSKNKKKKIKLIAHACHFLLMGRKTVALNQKLNTVPITFAFSQVKHFTTTKFLNTIQIVDIHFLCLSSLTA